ncbi:MAG: hypothetical protein AVDCRST_MAG64-3214 [uncultured Phycisphaerae bacterium]|uniref:PIN domain-containing protein n=1 Tax=uncultured Phycisphaerae bacterium TaxID=904963 RepID=A0A6J4PWV3_9BACT|nr:MAG: hypothetical protein AVDCRST_MAG64-3214 [uncultured Phycisphaerae bacterium]
MILLDTDHMTVIRYAESARHASLTSRMAAAADETFATTIVSAEEQMRGWLVMINKAPDARRQVPAYERLLALFSFYAAWQVVPFDELAADRFERLRASRVRIGTQDLKIASTALSRGATLLSANRKDFEKVPGLRVENWLS